MKQVVLALLLSAGAVAAFAMVFRLEEDPDPGTVYIDQVFFDVEILETKSSRVLGLSGREGLEEQAGAFFVFDRPDIHGIWMKDMNFAIDIIWISDGLRVIDVDTDVGPDTFPDVFRPSSPALYALEVRAGTVKKQNIKIGDEVIFERNTS